MYQRKNHYKGCLKVHLIFVTKYRKKIINNEIRSSIKNIFINISKKKNNFKIEETETDLDHIHLLVEYEPKISVLQIVRKLKQESTIGIGASYETIQNYIRSQG